MSNQLQLFKILKENMCLIKSSLFFTIALSFSLFISINFPNNFSAFVFYSIIFGFLTVLFLIPINYLIDKKYIQLQKKFVDLIKNIDNKKIEEERLIDIVIEDQYFKTIDIITHFEDFNFETKIKIFSNTNFIDYLYFDCIEEDIFSCLKNFIKEIHDRDLKEHYYNIIYLFKNIKNDKILMEIKERLYAEFEKNRDHFNSNLQRYTEAKDLEIVYHLKNRDIEDSIYCQHLFLNYSTKELVLDVFDEMNFKDKLFSLKNAAFIRYLKNYIKELDEDVIEDFYEESFSELFIWIYSNNKQENYKDIINLFDKDIKVVKEENYSIQLIEEQKLKIIQL